MNLDNPQEEGKVKSRIKDRTELMSQCSQREDREMIAQQLARPYLFGEEFRLLAINCRGEERTCLTNTQNVQSRVDETLYISPRDAVSNRKNNILPLSDHLGRSSANI